MGRRFLYTKVPSENVPVMSQNYSQRNKIFEEKLSNGLQIIPYMLDRRLSHNISFTNLTICKIRGKFIDCSKVAKTQV